MPPTRITEIPAPTQAECIVLERLAFDLRELVSPAFMRDMEVNASLDDTAHGMILRIRAYLWGKDSIDTLPDVTESKDEPFQRFFLPATWWDGAKHCFKVRFPKVGKRLNVNFREYTTVYRTVIVKKAVNHRHMCPHIDLPAHSQRHAMFCLRRDGE